MFVSLACVATLNRQRSLSMGNAFYRLQRRIERLQASRAAAMSPPDPSKVKRLPPEHHKGSGRTSSYEQGVLDGFNGNLPRADSDEGREAFGAYLAGVNAGSRARMLKAKRQQKDQRRWSVPDRRIPTHEEVIQELRQRESQDRQAKQQRIRSGILRLLSTK